jgi:hypothetical protein
VTVEIEQAATAVLVVHQRRDVGSCLCGWAELGRSHAQHQAKMLGGAGLLAERNGGQRA